MGDDQWWRHTSRPTKFYFSRDMKHFRKVNCITAKGKVISARFPHNERHPTSSGGRGSTTFGDAPTTSSRYSSPRAGSVGLREASSSTAAAATNSIRGRTSRQSSLASITSRLSVGSPMMAKSMSNNGDQHLAMEPDEASSRGQEVDLRHVYKVMRFYSFWKSCTAFHRIVTMVSPVDEKPVSSPNAAEQFKKRLFVQYLWRNAKPLEKARVQVNLKT